MPMADEKQINPGPVAEPQQQALSPENASALRDKRTVPEGVVPKQAQGYVVAGLAVLILMAVMFSKNHARPVAKESSAIAGAMATDVNQRKIQELEHDLSATQRQSQQAAAWKTGAAISLNGASPVSTSQLPPPVTAQPAEPQRDPIADAEKAM